MLKTAIDTAMNDWLDDEGGDLQDFLRFLDAQMKSHPDLVMPADEAQLARLEKLLALMTAWPPSKSPTSAPKNAIDNSIDTSIDNSIDNAFDRGRHHDPR